MRKNIFPAIPILFEQFYLCYYLEFSKPDCKCYCLTQLIFSYKAFMPTLTLIPIFVCISVQLFIFMHYKNIYQQDFLYNMNSVNQKNGWIDRTQIIQPLIYRRIKWFQRILIFRSSVGHMSWISSNISPKWAR